MWRNTFLYFRSILAAAVLELEECANSGFPTNNKKKAWICLSKPPLRRISVLVWRLSMANYSSENILETGHYTLKLVMWKARCQFLPSYTALITHWITSHEINNQGHQEASTCIAVSFLPDRPGPHGVECTRVPQWRTFCANHPARQTTWNTVSLWCGGRAGDLHACWGTAYSQKNHQSSKARSSVWTNTWESGECLPPHPSPTPLKI